MTIEKGHPCGVDVLVRCGRPIDFPNWKWALGGFEKGAVRREDTRGESCHVGEGIDEGTIDLVETFVEVNGSPCVGVAIDLTSFKFQRCAMPGFLSTNAS